jgi:hypothetical protein
MSESKTKQTTGSSEQKASRDARLAEALRANLRRRKEQARSRRDTSENETGSES